MRASVTLLSFPALVLALQAAPDIAPAGKGLPQVTNVLTPELEAHGLSPIYPPLGSECGRRSECEKMHTNAPNLVHPGT